MLEKLVSPFRESFISTLQMMAGIDCNAREPYLKGDKDTPGTICGLVGFAGPKVMGSVAVFYTKPGLLKFYQQMTGVEETEINHEVIDTVAELANIIAGGGKTEYSNQGIHFDIAIPSVVLGESIYLTYGPGARIMVIPFEVEDNVVYLEVMFKPVS